MALDLDAVHRAVADILRVGLGDAFNVSHCPSNMPVPVIEVWPGEDRWVQNQVTQDIEADVSLRVRVAAYMGDLDSGFNVMMRACSPASPTSVWALLQANPTLKGTVSSHDAATSRWEVDQETGYQVAWIPIEAME